MRASTGKATLELGVLRCLSLGLTQAGTVWAARPMGWLTFSLCKALFSSPSTCRSFLATPMLGRSVWTPRWQATPKPTGMEE